jgi:prevent-host-death family protein
VRSAYGHERVLVARRGRPVAAIVPIDDVEFIERIEDELDRQAALEALANPEDAETIPWERVKANSGCSRSTWPANATKSVSLGAPSGTSEASPAQHRSGSSGQSTDSRIHRGREEQCSSRTHGRDLFGARNTHKVPTFLTGTAFRPKASPGSPPRRAR